MLHPLYSLHSTLYSLHSTVYTKVSSRLLNRRERRLHHSREVATFGTFNPFFNSWGKGIYYASYWLID